MEGRETTNSGGITVVRSDTPSDYHVAPRSENFSQLNGSPAVATAAGVPGKKKRGRPKKYGPDGSVTKPLSPTPISSAPPSIIDFSAEHPGKVRPAGLASKKKMQSRIELESAGEWVSLPFGANFTPHIITVNAGEDVTMKLISFSQQGPQAICILSANGVISSVTLRYPDSCGGTLTYEGSYQILSLTGSFMPSESGGIRSRSGGMSVLLVSPDGRLVGGGVAGLLLASSPVQIIVGSFFTGNQQEQRIKKHKTESINVVTPTAAIPISRAEIENTYGGPGNTHQLL